MGAHPLVSTGSHGAVQLGFGDVDPYGREVHVVFLPLLPPNRPALSHAGSVMAPATVRARRRWRCGDLRFFPVSLDQREIGLPHLVRTVSLL